MDGLTDSTRPQGPEVKPWVRQLVESQELRLTEKALGWWSVHLEGFLRYGAKRGEEVDVIVLGKGYLEMLRETLPPSAGYRLDQTRQALTVFVRGIENWHWEKTPDGLLRPRFRLKQGGESTQRSLDQRENCPVAGAGDSPVSKDGRSAWEDVRCRRSEVGLGRGRPAARRED